MPTPIDAPFTDRFRLAFTDLGMIADERNGFVSDDDILDTAERWTTDSRQYEQDGSYGFPDGGDFERLLDIIWTSMAPEVDT